LLYAGIYFCFIFYRNMGKQPKWLFITVIVLSVLTVIFTAVSAIINFWQNFVLKGASDRV
jgi:hypothetical protein